MPEQKPFPERLWFPSRKDWRAPLSMPVAPCVNVSETGKLSIAFDVYGNQIAGIHTWYKSERMHKGKWFWCGWNWTWSVGKSGNLFIQGMRGMRVWPLSFLQDADVAYFTFLQSSSMRGFNISQKLLTDGEGANFEVLNYHCVWDCFAADGDWQIVQCPRPSPAVYVIVF